ncbi:HAD-like domain-containing protein [Hyaloraphidium curvatum]|nr:HAD-like domain-containing protein [Hyaloraphidium curvatum]
MPGKIVVLWDLGDVLVRLRWERIFERLFERIRELNPSCRMKPDAKDAIGTLKKSLHPGGLLYDRSLKYMSSPNGDDGWLPALAAEAASLVFEGQVELPTLAELEAMWCGMFDPWPEMMSTAEAVRELGHRYYILSNTDRLHYDFLSSGNFEPRLASILRDATGTWLSHEVGLCKPDPAYWTTFLEKHGLSERECLFIDDNEANVDAARALGFRAFRHHRPGDLATLRSWLNGNGVFVPGAELFG